MAEDWLARYRAYERRCVKADRLPEGKKREAALRRLSQEYDQLRSESPLVASSSENQLNAFEEAHQNLRVALLYSQCGRADRQLLDIWLDENCQGSPPPIDDEHLRGLILKVEWARDHVAVASPAHREPDGNEHVGDCRGYSDPSNYTRNKWLYEQRRSGLTISALRTELTSKCKETGWYPIDSDSGIRDAIMSYAAHHGLKIPRGRPGRPRKPAKP